MAEATALDWTQRVGPARAAAASTAETAVDCRGLVKTFAAGAVRALGGVSVAIGANEFFTLLGPSGCGKTTLLRLIAGFETQDAGTIAVHGQNLDGLPPFRRPVNTVFQSYAVFPHLTVAQNVAFGLEMQRRRRPEIARRVAEMLALVKLEGMETRKPAQLSGGQQQRVALARALATAPRVLLLDEPLSALDLKLRTGMQLELKRLQAEVGITFVFVTHDQREALTMSDRIAVMNHGKILQIGTPEDVYERPTARFVADFIGETNLIAAIRIGERRFRLASGEVVDTAETGPPEGRVTLAIRPERASLAPPGAGLAGTVEHIVYEGTDTTYHVLLAGGLRLRLREQNRESARPRVAAGEAVAVALPAAAIRILVE
ncbi:MAG: ABC transporter ATP-binding protein [Alphaproteobacteria bacterium]|nr:ABC transporter ATP-binding protein [Alphaproteobacteria bacterium]